MSINDLIKKTNLYTTYNQQSDAIVKVSILAQQILNKIIEIIQPGISESKATAAANIIFKEHGIEKVWHRPIIRFNKNTLLTFLDRPVNDYILQKNDIAFVDIGIVKDGIEGDIGKTIVFGNNKEFLHLKNVSEIIFEEAKKYWQIENPTGIKLYEFIHALAKKYKVIFNLSVAGHLIGAFPHTHAWTKGANTYPEKLTATGWILEIQIKSPTLPFGAFFEGLLH